MVASVQATLVVNFSPSGSDRSGHLSAEIDDRPTGFNKGNTSFVPGDTAYFLVYASKTVVIDGVFESAGSVFSMSEVTVEKEADIQFEGTNTASLPVPAQNITSHKWLGNNLGSLSLPGGPGTLDVRASATCPTPGACVAVCRVKFQAKAKVYALASPSSLAGLYEFPIVVLITGHEVS